MKKKLHIAPLIWCIFGITVSAISIYLVLKDIELYKQLGLLSTAIVLIILPLLIIVSYVLVLMLKKLGFYIFTAVSVISLLYNTIRFGFDLKFVTGLLGPIVLYLFLQLGDEEKSWDLLK